MVRAMINAAATAVKGLVGNRRVERRELIVVVDKPDGSRYVLTAEDNRFTIPHAKRTMARMYELLRPLWPFICSLNIVDGRRPVSFVCNHIEHDVVNVAPCNMVVPDASDPFLALEENGFSLVQLENHPHVTEIKRVMKFA